MPKPLKKGARVALENNTSSINKMEKEGRSSDSNKRPVRSMENQTILTAQRMATYGIVILQCVQMTIMM
jgi:hypothetical protein